MGSLISNPNDPTPLTPAMLLTLRQDNDVVREDFEAEDLLSYGKLRHRRVQYLSDHFWRRWRTEYLHTLNKRPKWQTRKPCIGINDVVLVRDKQSKRNEWPMGRVANVKRSNDGLVRSVTIQLSRKSGSAPRFLTRPISELVLLVSSKHHSEDATCTDAGSRRECADSLKTDESVNK